MNEAFESVRAFHQAFGVPAAGLPHMMAPGRVSRRANWISDEVQEFRDAVSLADQADAMIDIIYFALGGLVEMGIKPDGLFSIVQAANMAKLWPDGTAHFRSDSKILKPPGWVDPRPAIEAEIDKQVRGESTHG